MNRRAQSFVIRLRQNRMKCSWLRFLLCSNLRFLSLLTSRTNCVITKRVVTFRERVMSCQVVSVISWSQNYGHETRMSFNTQSSRRPVAVSSMSSLESSASAYDTVQERASLPETSTLDSLIPSPPHTNSVDLDNETSSNVPLAVSSSLHTSGTVLAAPVPIISRPAASVPAPASVSNNNTVAEFIFQLTKMLTDDNKDVIEWSNGNFPAWFVWNARLLTSTSPVYVVVQVKLMCMIHTS